LIDQNRRDMLTAKYGMNRPPMNPELNTTVAAILDNERIESGAGGGFNGPLFDPVWSPAMHGRADAAMAVLHAALANDELHIDSLGHDLEHGFDPAQPPSDAVFIWAVGSRHILACCRAGSSHDERRLRGPDYFASLLQTFAAVDDYHKYTAEVGVYGADYELKCTINIAKDCTAYAEDFGGGTTRQMTLRRGQFLLLFRCCRVCEDLVGQFADNNFKISVMEAQAKLPRGATIDPGSPVPLHP